MEAHEGNRRPNHGEFGDSRRAILRDVFVDFMGSLVPGLVFTAMSVVTIGLSGVLLFFLLTSAWQGKAPPVSISLKDAIEPFRWEFLVCFIFTSYVIGNLAYRADPKNPDYASAQFVYSTSSKSDQSISAVQPVKGSDWNAKLQNLANRVTSFCNRFSKTPRGRWGSWRNRIIRKICATSESLILSYRKMDVQFPYLFLHEYLSGRGLVHLSNHIPWQGNDPTTHQNRSKMFINVLKIRLNLTVPDHCGETIRTEAHIRLMSSVWFAAGWLKRMALVGLTISLGIVLFRGKSDFPIPQLSVVLSIWSAGVLAGGYFTRRSIRKFFHYQRVREVVYVIETAHWVKFRMGIDLFAHLQAPPGDTPRLAH